MESSSWLLKNEGLRHLWHPPLQFLQVATTCMHGHGRVPFFVKALWPTTHTSDTELTGGHPTDTTGDAAFPECLMHSGRLPRVQHSGRPSGDASHGEAFHKCQATSRGQFNTIDVISFFLPLPRVQHSGKKFLFWKPFPRVQHSGKNFVFFKKNSSPSACPRHSGKTDDSFFYKPSSPSAAAQALGEATFFCKN
jgi:hypothetical protein